MSSYRIWVGYIFCKCISPHLDWISNSKHTISISFYVDESLFVLFSFFFLLVTQFRNWRTVCYLFFVFSVREKRSLRIRWQLLFSDRLHIMTCETESNWNVKYRLNDEWRNSKRREAYRNMTKTMWTIYVRDDEFKITIFFHSWP